MTESRDERPLPSSNTLEHVEDWEVDQDNKCSTASNKATGTSANSADQVCCRINDHDDELILDNSRINSSEDAVVNEAKTVVTSQEDNQQECQVDDGAVVGTSVDDLQKCHLDEATDVTSVDNQSECHVRQSDRLSGDCEETNPCHTRINVTR